MKRVVILAYDFEPHNSIGAQRPLGWFKYFKEFGIHPIVITRHWDKIEEPNDLVKASSANKITQEESEFGTIIRVPYQPNLRDEILLKHGPDKLVVVRKLLSLLYSVGQYFSFALDNRSGIYKSAKDYIQKKGADAVIATGEPFILFRYASKLSKEFGIPWIADYRDGWSKNYGALHNAGALQKFINLRVFARIEKQLVKTANTCTVTVRSHKNEVESLVSGIKANVVMNGFFEDAFQSLPRVDSSAKPFTIAYSGTIYPYQHLEVFLDGFLKTVDEKSLSPNDIQIVFYGLEYQPEQLTRVTAYSQKLGGYIHHTPKMAYKSVIEKLNEANMLLLLATPEKQQIYAKVFDYIALQKPILMVSNDHGPLEEIVSDCPNPLICESAEDVFKLLSNELKSERSVESSSKSVSKYSRRNQAKLMASIVEDQT